MIHEVTGDILLSKAQGIAHGIAPNEHFTSGLALSLRDAWPAMAQDYRHYAHQTRPKRGEMWSCGGAGGVRVFNLLTQDGEHTHGARPGRATVSHVNYSLRSLRHELDKGELKSLAMLKLATGAGGLAWGDVYPLIRQHLGDLQIPVFIYMTFHRGQPASESGG